MKIKSNPTLSDKIAGILNSAPSNFDPEEDGVDNTNAQIVQEVEDNHEEQEEILSNFRRANVDLLADLDDKYSGKKTSRKNLQESDSDEFSEHGESDDDSEEEFQDNHDDAESENLSDVNPEESEKDEEDGDDNKEHKSDYIEDLQGVQYLEDNDNFRHIIGESSSSQNKSIHVRNQIAMWEHLLEIRIQLQKCLITANKMPYKETYTQIKKESGSEFSNKVNETQITLCDSLNKLIELQRLLLKQYPETKKIKEHTLPTNIDDDEIESDSNGEQSEHEEVLEETETPRRKKRKLEEYEEELSEQHKIYKDYRNKVIQKWSDKTQLILKGGVILHSILDQIEYNLNNKDKLIMKTQVKRSPYAVLGEELKEDDKLKEQCNTEIFDDDDFYHQLLRELIAVKSADVTDPVQLGRQWIQLQNARNKMKRKIDTRATKGRKIRYAVHTKLVNFMGPIEQNLWTDEATNELFNSLFGKNV